MLVLLLPVFVDFMIIPGYVALFLLVSFPLALLTPKVRGIRHWHLLAFAPVLYCAEQLTLFLLSQSGGVLTPATILEVREFASEIGPTGIISSVLVYIFTGFISSVAILLQEKRSILYIHRMVDTEDEWNRVFSWMRENERAPDLSEFRWRLLQRRCFVFVAIRADQILASILLTPGQPGTAYLSDFVFRDKEIGFELLSGILGRPEFQKVKRIHFISRTGDDPTPNAESMSEIWLRHLFSEDCFQNIDESAMQEIRRFTPDGSQFQPFQQASPLFTFLNDAASDARIKKT